MATGSADLFDIAGNVLKLVRGDLPERAAGEFRGDNLLHRHLDGLRGGALLEREGDVRVVSSVCEDPPIAASNLPDHRQLLPRKNILRPSGNQHIVPAGNFNVRQLPRPIAMGDRGRGNLCFAHQREDGPAGPLGQIAQQPRIAAGQPGAIGEQRWSPAFRRLVRVGVPPLGGCPAFRLKPVLQTFAAKQPPTILAPSRGPVAQEEQIRPPPPSSAFRHFGAAAS